MYSTRAIPRSTDALTATIQRLIAEVKAKNEIIASQQSELTGAYVEIADLQRKLDGTRFMAMDCSQEYERLERRYYEMRMAQP